MIFFMSNRQNIGSYWFLWLEWLFVYGAISYLADTTNSFLIDILAGISLMVLFNYFWAQLIIILKKVFPTDETTKMVRIIAFVIGVLFMVCIYLFIQSLIPDLKRLSNTVN